MYSQEHGNKSLVCVSLCFRAELEKKKSEAEPMQH